MIVFWNSMSMFKGKDPQVEEKTEFCNVENIQLKLSLYLFYQICCCLPCYSIHLPNIKTPV
jgi:hypothetical protein